MKSTDAVSRYVLQRARSIRNLLKLAYYGAYDLYGFARQSGACVGDLNVRQEDADIIRRYHAIEKGLALPSPRPGFGKAVLIRLCGLLRNRLAGRHSWTEACQDALNAIAGYKAFSLASGIPVLEEIDQLISEANRLGIVPSGTPVTTKMTRDEVDSATDFDAERFFWSRRSVRQFAPGAIDKDKLFKAVDLGRSVPSVCNRQSGRVKIIFNGESNMDFLKLQNGNRGFGSDAQAILVVTSDRSAFVQSEERYQAWIDGGMYAMTIALGLHAHGFGACCLNWSQPVAADRALREALDIPSNETVIMLIAVGNLPSEFHVAKSPRYSASHVSQVIQA